MTPSPSLSPVSPADLTSALKNLWLASASGTDSECLASLSVAGDLLASIGALDAGEGEA